MRGGRGGGERGVKGEGGMRGVSWWVDRKIFCFKYMGYVVGWYVGR